MRLEPTSSRERGTNLPLKGNQKTNETASNKCKRATGTQLGFKTNYTYFLKLLFAAAEIMRRLDRGEGIFFCKLNQF